MAAERKNQGFTLIELMLVLAILAVLLAVGWPNYVAYQNGLRVRETSNRVAQFFQATATQALNSGKLLTVNFALNQASGPDLTVTDATGTVLSTLALENDAAIASVLEDGVAQNTVKFDVRGRPSNAASLVVTTKLASLAGTVRLLVTGKTVIQ